MTLNKRLAPPTPSSSGLGTPAQTSSAVPICDGCRSKWRRLRALSSRNGRRWTWGGVGTPPATVSVHSDLCPCRGGSRLEEILQRSTAVRGSGVQIPEYLRQCYNKEKSGSVDTMWSLTWWKFKFFVCQVTKPYQKKLYSSYWHCQT